MKVLDKKRKAINQFANESPCICFNVRKAARAITQIYDNMLKATGLTATQMSILTSTHKIGSMTVSQLSEAMATDRTTITRNLKPLTRDGYIKIAEGEDRREREIKLTQKGINAIVKVMPIFQQFMGRVDKKIGKSRMEKLCKDLSSMVDEIQKI